MPYTCDLFGTSISHSDNLIYHIQNRIKEKIKTKTYYSCDLYDRSCELYCFSIHLEKLIAVKVYPCEVCGKWISSSTDSSQHQFLHNGDKPCICNFYVFCLLQETLPTLPTNIGEESYKCDICNQLCTRCSSMHDLSHVISRLHVYGKPFACQSCSNSLNLCCPQPDLYISNFALVKSYSCTVCNKSFLCLLNLA